MKKLLALLLPALSAAAAAQTPAVNLMPDGSRDMYIGLGAIVQPRYEGAHERRTRALPLLQVELSNGVFLAGMGAGWHLSQQPALEFGPLLALHPGRDADGVRASLGAVAFSLSGAEREQRIANRLAGQAEVKARLTGGAFLHFYLSPRLRLNNTLLYGAGGKGLAWEASVQTMTPEMDARHRVSLSAGLTLVNRAYNHSFFGVDDEVGSFFPIPGHYPDGGVKDVFVGARWNWAVSPAWVVTTSARAARLAGDARRSPLTERAGQFSISTGLARRF